MKYTDEHWAQVAKRYKEESLKVTPSELIGGKTNETVIIEKVQNHYPNLTKGTVAAWIRRCRKDGWI